MITTSLCSLLGIQHPILNASMSETATGRLAAAVSEARSLAAKGVAAAMAMGDAPMPSAPGKTSWAAQLANYKGHSAMGASVVHRLATNMPLALSAGVSGSSGSVGVRVGLKGEF